MVNNELKTLSEIFSNSIFRIPDYQRGYAWNKDQFDDFWEDLAYMKKNNYHYTGLLTVQKINREDIETDGAKHAYWQDDLWMFEKGYNAYYVIDGQQRLTTISILLGEIFNQYDDDILNFQTKDALIEKYLYQKLEQNESFIFGYEQNNPSDNYFKTEILDRKTLLANQIPETLYTSNLQYAKNYFKNKIDELSNDEIKDLFVKVSNRLKFNLYEIDDEFDVFVTFETMNNRGKPLSKLELLKNRLIYLTTILPEDDKDNGVIRREINNVWKTVYEYLGKNKDNPLDENDFLRNHWIMYFRFTKEADAYSNFLLNKHFIVKNIMNETIDYNENHLIIGYDDIREYISSITESIKMWYYISNPSFSDFNDDIKEYLEKLNRLGGALKPLIMCAMVKYANKEFNEEKLLELLKASEKFMFLVFKVTGRQSNTERNKFYLLANDFHNGKYKNGNPCEIEDVIDHFNWLVSSNNLWTGYDINRFNQNIENLFKKGGGFYKWAGIKYFLYEYELYLQKCSSEERHRMTWNDAQKQNTIEHIYPQTANMKCWCDKFNKFDEEQRKHIQGSLGNLLLLSGSKNSELQNDCFEFKKKHINNSGHNSGYFHGSYSEIEVAQYEDWTPKEVLERGIEMLEFMEKRWDIKIENKKRLLYLDFVN